MLPCHHVIGCQLRQPRTHWSPPFTMLKDTAMDSTDHHLTILKDTAMNSTDHYLTMLKDTAMNSLITTSPCSKTQPRTH